MLQVHGKCLLQSAVEDLIARGVGEIRENDGVFCRERVNWPGPKVENSSDGEQEQNRGSRE